MSKKKLLILVIVIILLIIPVYSYIENTNNNRQVLENSHTIKSNNSNTLSLMYETSAGSGEYVVSNSSTWPSEGYIFNERLSKCENGSKLTWDDTNKKVVLKGNISDKCYVYFDKTPTFSEYITNLYTVDGENGLYLHDSDLANGANDNSLRYSGADPSNYVCFGTDATSCPNDNLYRIIGVFDGRVKLIKYKSATEDLLGEDGGFYGSKYWWNKSGENTWSTSELNKINLNTNFINNIGSTWAAKVATTTWQVGGMASSSTNTAKQYYNAELNSGTTYNAKIGLMYVSDYGFATGPENWTTSLLKYSGDTIINNNWIYIFLDEWTISRDSSKTDMAFLVGIYGSVSANGLSANWVRPSFYLESSVTIVGGSGTLSDPYRIN